MTANRQPGRRSLPPLKRSRQGAGEDFGIKPDQRDGWGKRIGLLLGGVGLTGTVIAGGLYLLRPKPAVDPFEDIPVLDGAQIVCADIADYKYPLEDSIQQMIAGGSPATYSAAEEAAGGPRFVEEQRARPATIAACIQYRKDHKDTPDQEVFTVDSRTEPVAGREGIFRVIVDVVPTGDVAAE